MSGDALCFLEIIGKKKFGQQLSSLDGGDEFFLIGLQDQKPAQGAPSAFTHLFPVRRNTRQKGGKPLFNIPVGNACLKARS